MKRHSTVCGVKDDKGCKDPNSCSSVNYLNVSISRGQSGVFFNCGQEEPTVSSCSVIQNRRKLCGSTRQTWFGWWLGVFFSLPDLMLRLVLMNSLVFTGAELARLVFLKQDRRPVPVILTRPNVNEAD